MNQNAPGVWVPALIGGAVFGVLGAIPVVNFLNCACCSLVIASGLLGAFLYSKECRKSGATFGAGGGAKVGVVAGVFYNVFGFLTQGLLGLLTGKGMDETVAEAVEQIESNPQVPPEAAEMIANFLQSGGLVLVMVIFAVVALVFATIGGVIGGSVFKVEAPAPPPPPA